MRSQRKIGAKNFLNSIAVRQELAQQDSCTCRQLVRVDEWRATAAASLFFANAR